MPDQSVTDGIDAINRARKLATERERERDAALLEIERLTKESATRWGQVSEAYAEGNDLRVKLEAARERIAYIERMRVTASDDVASMQRHLDAAHAESLARGSKLRDLEEQLGHMRLVISYIHGAIATIADEGFGPLPVRTIEENLSAIEQGISRLRIDGGKLEFAKHAIDLWRPIVKFACDWRRGLDVSRDLIDAISDVTNGRDKATHETALAMVAADARVMQDAASARVNTMQQSGETCAHEINRIVREKLDATTGVDMATPGTDHSAVAMFLTCPLCGTRHIDTGEFATKIHETHGCQACGLVWKPAKVPTVGVRFLPGYHDEVGPTLPIPDRPKAKP